MRRWYAYEITDQGLVPVPRDGLPGADDPDGPSPGPGRRKPAPSPYRLALPAEAGVGEDPLRLRLDFHGESVLLHDYAGGVVRTRLVSALDVAHALAGGLDLADRRSSRPARCGGRGRPRASGPPSGGSRGCGRCACGSATTPRPGACACRCPASSSSASRGARRPTSSPPRAGPGARRTSSTTARRYNVFRDGARLHRLAPLPRRPGEGAGGVLPLPLLGHRRHRPGQVAARTPRTSAPLWAELDGRDAFPLDDLVPALRVADAFRVGA